MKILRKNNQSREKPLNLFTNKLRQIFDKPVLNINNWSLPTYFFYESLFFYGKYILPYQQRKL